MKSDEFKKFAKKAIDFVADYVDNIRDRQVVSSVEPGYLRSLLPAEPPEHPEDWTNILPDFERFIMPGVTHWHSPFFNAYYPTGHSYPSIVGDILSSGLGVVGFSWKSSPACTELELIMMDWLVKLFSLPEHFLNDHPGPGGGVIMGTASEATLMAVLAAREKAKGQLDPSLHHTLVAYASVEANSSVERSGLLAGVKMRLVDSGGEGMDTAALTRSIEKDLKEGLTPFCVVATLGTTSTCRFDNLQDLGPFCKKNGLWLHVDAAYAGGAFICEEHRHHMKGIEEADSLVINPHKWLRVNLDCTAAWFRNSMELIRPFMIERDYLTSQKEGGIPDLRHWEVALGRRFRSLKLWLTLRAEGAEGLRAHVRSHCQLAQGLQRLAQADQRFQVDVPAVMGLVCFSLKGEETLTQQLLEDLAKSRRIFILPSKFKGRLTVRYVVCSAWATESDLQEAWSLISNAADLVLKAGEKRNHFF